MSRLPSAQAEAALEHLTKQFTHWRQSRPRRARIPSVWWAQAVSLTYVLPISRVAKRLGLGLAELKKRRGSPPHVTAETVPLTFVEVTAPASQTAVGMKVEVQRPDGARLQLTAGEPTPALVALVQTFWEPR